MKPSLLLAAALLCACGAPIHKAARNNDADAIRALAASGADLNAYNDPIDKWTAVEMAASRGHKEALIALLDAGAKPALGRHRSDAARRHPELVALIEERAAGPAAPRAASAAAAPALPAPRAISSDVDAPARRGAPRPDDFALVIGIETYSRLPEAAFAEHDADAMKRHLLALGYPERNIILLKGGQATRGAISGYVEEWLPKNAKPGSAVFVYFSGHGSPDPKTGDAYLVPWDGDAMFLKSTAYPLKSLYASLGRLKAKRVLVALDSCFSGAGGRSVLAEGARPLVTRTEVVEAPAGVTVLSAASGDEITATIKEQGHGAFTYYLLKAFNNGKLTARAAYDELRPSVQDEARRQNREQTPLLTGEDAAF